MPNQRESRDQVAGEMIDLESNDLGQWAKKLGVSEDQIREAVNSVGTLASDVELHLKGSRSTTNTEKVEDAGKPD